MKIFTGYIKNCSMYLILVSTYTFLIWIKFVTHNSEGYSFYIIYDLLATMFVNFFPLDFSELFFFHRRITFSYALVYFYTRGPIIAAFGWNSRQSNSAIFCQTVNKIYSNFLDEIFQVSIKTLTIFGSRLKLISKIISN